MINKFLSYVCEKILINQFKKLELKKPPESSLKSRKWVALFLNPQIIFEEVLVNLVSMHLPELTLT